MENITLQHSSPFISSDVLSWFFIWIIGGLLSLFSLLIVILSREKLKRIELVILLSLNVTSLAFKIFVIVQFSIVYFAAEIVLSCPYTIISTCGTMLNEKIFMSLFYYSLFQVSSISREKLFLVLFNLVQSVRNFIIYEIITFILIIAFTSLYTMFAYFKTNNTCPNMSQILREAIEYKFLFGYFSQSVLAVIVYISATLYLCFIRFRYRKYQSEDKTTRNNRLEISKFRKNLKILVKFLILALIILLSSLFQNLFYYSSYVYGDFSSKVIIYADIGFILYMLQPFFFIYIHRILEKTFISYFTAFLDTTKKFLNF